ncbi:MAG: serine/threonine-protein kinase [bacterium]
MSPSDDTPTSAGGPSPPDSTLRQEPSPGAGRLLGPYRLLQKIGEGGMGEVWLAEQREPIQRNVALKIIKPGMDSREIIGRFEAERQALALMNHPCIAKVFDAGTTENGRPYFAMEYVPGLPLHEYCDRHQLDTRKRLELFIRVCQGVQHAHQKAVIHRDLKPTNVLVTEVDGVPTAKIIDFGVAKATAHKLTDQTMFTEVGAFIGTPEYMSPEQADLGTEDIDTRADIYSLGVMLYELLAGALPFDIRSMRRAGFDAMRKVIREQEPLTPSKKLETLGEKATEIAARRATEFHRLRRSLQGDLDWIVLKAMEKERNRRYETANGLALDIGRFLADEPVQARPPTAGYRLRKLVRRNRGAFRALVAVFAVLVLGIAATSWGLLRAKRAERMAAYEAKEAHRQAEIAQAVNDFLNQDLLSTVAPSVEEGRGIDVRMREVLDVAAARLDESSAPGGRFADKPLVEAAIRQTLGSTYLASGEYETALPQFEREVELRMEHQGEDDIQTAWALHDEALAQFRLGRLEEAERGLQRVLRYEEHASPAEAKDVAEWKATLGMIYEDAGRFEEAEALLLDVLASQKRDLGPDHPNTTRTMTTLANIYQRTGRYAECEALAKQVLEVCLRTDGEEAPETLRILSNLANVIANQGRLREAQEYMIRALEAKKRVLGPENPSTLNSMNNVAEVFAMLDEWDQAEALHRETWQLRAKVLGADHPRTLGSRVLLANAMARNGKAAEAAGIMVDTLARIRKVRGPDHPDTDAARHVYAVVLLAEGRPARAEKELRSLLADLAGTSREAELREFAQLELAVALMARNEKKESLALLREALPGLPPADAETRQALDAAIGALERWRGEAPGAGYDAEITRLQEFLASGNE